MFETAELGQSIDDASWEAHAPVVRTGLLAAQQALRDAPFPVIIVFVGVQKSGVGDTLNFLNSWMDPRGIRTLGFLADEDEALPVFWRYQPVLPPRGQTALFDRAWYRQPMRDFLKGKLDQAGYDEALAEVRAFEKLLSEDGALVLKFWLHLSAKQQKARLDALAKDPDQAWRVESGDKAEVKHHAEVVAAAEHMITQTQTAERPWHVVEGSDPRYRDLRVAMVIKEALERRLAEVVPRAAPVPATLAATVLPRSILSTVDLGKRVNKDEFAELLPKAQGRLARLHREAHARGLRTVLAFEGWDAAGKGGAIRRLTGALDSRQYIAVPIAAPNEEERAYHYLWRFWRRLPPAGCMTIFDRSWYGRVLVERVEGFATPEAWGRAYAEINEFERALVRHGVVVAKFWLHIDADEQAQRFSDRAEAPWKQWKLTDDDWRNREKRPLYEAAVHEMVERTSTRHAPWHLIGANDKEYARLKVLGLVANTLEAALEAKGSKASR